jgi:integrase
MASLYQRPNSPHWWIKFRESSGRIRQHSTRLRRDSIQETRQARALAAERAAAELRQPGRLPEGEWSSWVIPFLDVKCQARTTRERYGTAWSHLRTYLLARGIRHPSQVTFGICWDYAAWRKTGDPRGGILQASANTAIWELRVLRIIMEHAVRSGYAATNTARRLGLVGTKPAEKPEIPDHDIAAIWNLLAREPRWMQTAFQVSLYTGCRLKETRLNLETDIDLERMEIAFRNPKGAKPFVVPLRSELASVFAALRTTGATHSIEWPSSPSFSWHAFFQKHKFPYCFHCLRVTFITRCLRSGLTERQAMLLVNHASSTVNRIYQRYRVADLRDPLQRIALPELRASTCTP